MRRTDRPSDRYACGSPVRVVARVAAGLAGVLALTAVGLTAVATVAAAATVGSEVIVTPGTTKPLASGGSRTPYAVVLPSGAACPGDTAHHGYLVYSYLVPADASPTEVSFRGGIPSRWFGFIADGAYFGAVNTAESTGQVVGLPGDFVWTRLTPADLFPLGAHTSTWNGGIACATSHGVVTTYWNSRIVFTADGSDPGGFTWRVVDQGAVASSTPVELWIGIGLVVVAAGAAAYALRLRRVRKEDVPGSDGDGPAGGGPGPDDGPGPAVDGGVTRPAPTTVGVAES